MASPVVQSVRELVRAIVQAREEEEFALVARRGPPRIQIQEDRLCFLIESGFKVNDVAAICACSRRTIERRLQE